MKLTGLETFIVGNPPPHFGGRYFIFVKLSTACGVVGYGEIYVATFGPKVVAAMAADLFARVFEGTDPHRIETAWRRAYGSGYAGRPDPTLVGVLSGLEMACWDIIGKAADKPVYELLGGKVWERLRSYTYLYPTEGGAYPDPAVGATVYDDPDLAAAAAAAYVGQGFTAVKFDPAGAFGVFDPRMPDLEHLSLSARFVARIREAVGDKADLLFGTHGQFTPAGALRLARRLEAADPLWFEEPTPPDFPEGMGLVARGTTIPVATGERLASKYDIAAVLRTGAAAILQPNLGRIGGLLEGKKVAALAEAHHVQIAPHLYCGPLVGAANIQLAACSPNFLILESIERWDGFFAQLVSPGIQWEEGYIRPPEGPGLGLALNEDVARAHPYLGGELHLVPASDPIA